MGDALRRLGERVAERAILYEIARKDMPQVSGDRMRALISYVKGLGMLCTLERVHHDELRAIQDDFSRSKVQAVADHLRDGGRIPPCVVSLSYAILDGHHRAKGVRKVSREDGRDLHVPVLRIHAETEDALTVLRDFVSSGQPGEPTDTVVVMPVRAQPFHRGNAEAYEDLVSRFGAPNVYVVTSGRTSPPEAPFTFPEKRRIITALAPVPPGQVVEVANAYDPSEVLEDRDPETTRLVLAVPPASAAAVRRSALSSYYRPFDPSGRRGYGEAGYLYKTPDQTMRLPDAGALAPGAFADFMLSDAPPEVRRSVAMLAVGTEDPALADEIFLRYSPEPLSPDALRSFLRDRTPALAEAVRTAAVPVDDGPATWYEFDEEFASDQEELARRMGLQVVRYLGSTNNFDLKRDALPYASFYPAGDDPNYTPSVSDPDGVWRAFATAVAEVAGMEVIDWLGAEVASSYERAARGNPPGAI